MFAMPAPLARPPSLLMIALLLAMPVLSVDGRTWTPMASNGLVCVMPFCTVVPIEGGKKLLGLTNIRRPGETKEVRSNVVAHYLNQCPSVLISG